MGLLDRLTQSIIKINCPCLILLFQREEEHISNDARVLLTHFILIGRYWFTGKHLTPLTKERALGHLSFQNVPKARGTAERVHGPSFQALPGSSEREL